MSRCCVATRRGAQHRTGKIEESLGEGSGLDVQVPRRDAAQCAADGVSLAEAQLAASWWVGNMGMLTTMGLMLWACLTSDWDDLARQAQESAEIIEEGGDGDGGGRDGSESSSDAGGAAAAEPEGPSGF